MSDVQLPPEGVVVLAWWGGHRLRFAMRIGGQWRERNDSLWVRGMGPPDHWVHLSHAKAATRLVEAAKKAIERRHEWGDPPVGICAQAAEYVVEPLRAVLSEINT